MVPIVQEKKKGPRSKIPGREKVMKCLIGLPEKSTREDKKVSKTLPKCAK